MIYRITYPNGKIYVGQDVTNTLRIRTTTHMKRALAAAFVASIIVPLSVTSPAQADSNCVSQSEYYSVHKGDTRAHVRRVFDTDGRRLSKQDGVLRRGYRICRTQDYGVVVKYRRHNEAWRLRHKSANAA